MAVDFSKLPHSDSAGDVKGRLLKLPRTGFVVAPYKQSDGGWLCVVVSGDATYPRGGYDIFVFDDDLTAATEVGFTVE